MAEWIAVQLEAADLLGRLRDGWTRPAAVLVDAAEPRAVVLSQSTVPAARP